MRGQRLITAMVLGACLLGSPKIGRAFLGVGDTAIVLDPANLEQGVLTVEGITTTIEQQKQMIQDQLTMVTQGAKNLLATPVDMVNQVKSVMDQYNSALQTVQGIGYTVDSAKQQWEALFGAVSSGSLPEKARAIAQAIQAASAQASQAEAVYTRLCAQATQIQTLLEASKAAPGSRAALQVQTQLNAVLSDQLQTLTQMQMTEGRAHVMQIAEDARTTAQSVQNSQNWISGFTDPENMPRPLGQGKGMQLPN